jgi:hypothetical protein
MEKLDYKKLADYFIDNMCEIQGVIPTIIFLINAGFSDSDLQQLCFDVNDIEIAKGSI